jgi:hypothetical protein
MPHPPEAGQLSNLTAPALMILAGNSKAHDVSKVRAGAGRLLPALRIAELRDASHHSLPSVNPGPLNAGLASFLAS